MTAKSRLRLAKSRSACMRSVFTTRSKASGQHLHKLWVNALVYPQVVFVTGRLRTSSGFVSSLSERLAQLYALLFYAFYAGISLFIHTIHSPNNKYYKGE